MNHHGEGLDAIVTILSAWGCPGQSFVAVGMGTFAVTTRQLCIKVSW